MYSAGNGKGSKGSTSVQFIPCSSNYSAQRCTLKLSEDLANCLQASKNKAATASQT